MKIYACSVSNTLNSTDCRNKRGKEKNWTVPGEFNYCKIKEDTGKNKNQLGSKLWEQHRGQLPYALSDLKRKLYGRINSQFSAAPQRGCEWRWKSGSSTLVPATTVNYIWARFSCRLGREALWSGQIQYQEKIKDKRILGKQILEAARGANG